MCAAERLIVGPGLHKARDDLVHSLAIAHNFAGSPFTVTLGGRVSAVRARSDALLDFRYTAIALAGSVV